MKLLTALFSMLIGGSAAAQVTWTMPTAYPDSNFHTKNIRLFSEQINKETQGKLNIVVHSGGALIRMPEIKRAVQSGQVQIGEILIGAMTNEAPIYSFETIPFMVSGYDQGYKLWTAVRPLIEARLAKQNLKVLYSVAWPTQGVYSNEELKDISQLKSLRFRSSSASAAEFAKRIGASPVVVQGADVPQAFMTGMVSAMMTSAATGVDTQAWDYVKYYYDVPTMSPQSIVFVNKAAWEKLDSATQKIVENAAAKAEKRGWQMSRDEATGGVKRLKEEGMNVLVLNPAVETEMRKVGAEMKKGWLEKLQPEERQAVESGLQ
ncbi:TRAP transporter substrate-binding protein [Pollutimonas sp. H1-120]|uniref:TRAP transporter substrate-binding protein n=1 Tax=Pollutimonas sp. H1-120 TaxID=3148824 RepID=UPI003B524327